MAGKSKNPPMDYSQMVETGAKKKENSRVYSVKDASDNDIKLAELITASVKELADAAEAIGTVSLSDAQTVKKRTLLYVRACADSGSLPTFSGLLRSFGMTARAGYEYIQRNPDSQTGKWLEMYRDYCADLLADAALRGMTHPVFSIFVEKARNLWRDSITIETVQHDPLGENRTPEDIVAQYRDLMKDGYFE